MTEIWNFLKFQHHRGNSSNCWYPKPKHSGPLLQKILSAIKKIRDKKNRPDIDAIFDHLMKNSGLNIDKEFIEGVIVELIKGNVITNKKTATVCDSFYCLIET